MGRIMDPTSIPGNGGSKSREQGVKMGKVTMRFGEVVLRTSRYDALKSWYSQVLDTQPMFESERKATTGSGGMRQMCTIRPYSEFPFIETLVILDFCELRQ